MATGSVPRRSMKLPAAGPIACAVTDAAGALPDAGV